jgi:hypothetical protein
MNFLDFSGPPYLTVSRKGFIFMIINYRLTFIESQGKIFNHQHYAGKKERDNEAVQSSW